MGVIHHFCGMICIDDWGFYFPVPNKKSQLVTTKKIERKKEE